MASGVRRNGFLVGLGLIVLAVLVYAWIDGGREPLREIVMPVPLPEHAR